MGDVEDNPDLYEALAGNYQDPDPLPRDNFTLRGSDADAFLDLREEGRDKWVNQHVDERAAYAGVIIDYDSEKLIAEVKYIYVPDS